MRSTVFFFLLTSTASGQQIPLERFDVFQPVEDRPNIEIVPVMVWESDRYLGILESSGEDAVREELESVFRNELIPSMTDMMLSTRQAMHTLGVFPDQYNLVFADHTHALICSEADLYAEQQCFHGDLGEITNLPDFVKDLYDGESPPIGTVQLHVVHLLGNIAWKGVLGVAWSWAWKQAKSDWHWTNRSCRAWALHSVPVVAHELGHCFGLDHNEQNLDGGLDLMLSRYAHYNWVKDSNKEIVQQHFRHPTPDNAVLTLMNPNVELAY